jgi:hypothetical protein
VIRFLTLIGLIVRAIGTEPGPIYGPEVLVSSTVKKGRKPFHQGRTDLFDDSRLGKPLTNDLAGAIGFTLEERPLNSRKKFVATSGLER